MNTLKDYLINNKKCKICNKSLNILFLDNNSNILNYIYKKNCFIFNSKIKYYGTNESLVLNLNSNIYIKNSQIKNISIFLACKHCKNMRFFSNEILGDNNKLNLIQYNECSFLYKNINFYQNRLDNLSCCFILNENIKFKFFDISNMNIKQIYEKISKMLILY